MTFTSHTSQNRSGTVLDVSKFQQADYFLKAEDLSEILGVSKRTVWRWRSSGKIPEPVTIAGSTRWRSTVIRSWVEDGCLELGRN